MTPTTKEERDYWKADMNRAFSAGGHRVVPYTHTERLIADVNRLEAENARLREIAERLRSGILDYSDHTVKCSYRPPTSFDAVKGDNVPGIPCDCGLDQLMIETDAALQPKEPTP